MHHNTQIKLSRIPIAMIRVPNALAITVAVSLTSVAFSQSVLPPEKENSAEAELKSFTLAEGYEANLFADESDGVANPVCMRWDSAGRLWVLCTWAYPQLKPIDKPNDKLLILTDTDGDGRADKTTVFADGLNMPTGFALGHGGAYVGEGNNLIHLKDTDGDDKADTRRVLLTGFGTGDTHQNINSFTWSPGGELLFCQGLHAFSRVETPWGIRRLDEHGSWRLRPKLLELDGFRRTSGGGNPWGIAFANWGEPFVKSNGTSIAELLPSMVSSEHTSSFWGGEMSIGKTRIKSMIIEFAESPHLPDEIQGEMLIAGYFARDVNRLKWATDGSGHKAALQPNLMASSHRAYRPVDIQIGPDGAIYIADWFNPIIGHYQASLRHPHRDKTHGRIWRITARGRPLAKAPDLSKMNASELCDQLESDWRYVRLRAKRRLADLPKDEAISAVTKWVAGLDPDDPATEHRLFEAIGVFESHEVVNRPLLERLLAAKDHRARAYATRVAARWHDRLDAPLELLRRSAADAHPRVRLEAIVGCSDIRVPQAMVVAASATSQPMDRFLDYALTQTTHALAPHWRPALASGEIQFYDPQHMIFVLRTMGGNDVAGQARALLKSDSLSAEGRRQLYELLAEVGNPKDIDDVFEAAVADQVLLTSLADIMERRRVIPAGKPVSQLHSLIDGAAPETQAATARLAGIWKKKELVGTLWKLVGDGKGDPRVVTAAIKSVGELEGEAAVTSLRRLIVANQHPRVRIAALDTIARLNVSAAAVDGLALIEKTASDGKQVDQALAVVMPFNGSVDALAGALMKVPPSPNAARQIIRWLNASGRAEPKLNTILFAAIDTAPSGPMKHSDQLVRTLVLEAQKSGDPIAGRKVFQSPLIGCVACHQVRGINQLGPNAKGPDLSALAAGLPANLIVESVIWPKRQIKEGYEAASLILKDGRTVTGYVAARQADTTSIRDMATNELITIANDSITKTVKIGTIMPEGLTSSLTRKQLRDLMAYLTSLE